MLQLLAVLTCKDVLEGGQLPLNPQLFVCDSTPYAAVITSMLLSSSHSSLAGFPLCSQASTRSDKTKYSQKCLAAIVGPRIVARACV